MALAEQVEVIGVGIFDDINSLLFAIEEGHLNDDPQLEEDLTEALEAPDQQVQPAAATFECQHCERKFTTKRGLSRHTTCVHGDVVTKESRKFDGRKVDEALFGSFLHRSVEHVRQDLCQTEEVQVELANF